MQRIPNITWENNVQSECDRHNCNICVFHKTKEQCTDEYEKRLKISNRDQKFKVTRNREWPFGYDAAWALAIMLNESVEVLKKLYLSVMDTTRRLEDFTYQDEEMAKLFFNILNETRFEGLTVSIHGFCFLKTLNLNIVEVWLKHGWTLISVLYML